MPIRRKLRKAAATPQKTPKKKGRAEVTAKLGEPFAQPIIMVADKTVTDEKSCRGERTVVVVGAPSDTDASVHLASPQDQDATTETRLAVPTSSNISNNNTPVPRSSVDSFVVQKSGGTRVIVPASVNEFVSCTPKGKGTGELSFSFTAFADMGNCFPITLHEWLNSFIDWLSNRCSMSSIDWLIVRLIFRSLFSAKLMQSIREKVNATVLETPKKRTAKWFSETVPSLLGGLAESDGRGRKNFVGLLMRTPCADPVKSDEAPADSDEPLTEFAWGPAVEAATDCTTPVRNETTKTFRMSYGRNPDHHRRRETNYNPSNEAAAVSRINFKGFLDNEKAVLKRHRKVRNWRGGKSEERDFSKFSRKVTDVNDDEEWSGESGDENTLPSDWSFPVKRARFLDCVFFTRIFLLVFFFFLLWLFGFWWLLNQWINEERRILVYFGILSQFNEKKKIFRFFSFLFYFFFLSLISDSNTCELNFDSEKRRSQND